MSKIFRSFALLGALFTVPMANFAQQVAGVTGIVTDKTGSPIEGATVKLVNANTGFAQEASTNENGSYLFQKIQPGPDYVLTFSKDGFQSFTITNVYLGVSTTSTQNAQLEIGLVQQTVEVRAEGEGTLNTTDASIGNVINTRTLHELPTLNRGDVSAFLRLEPGVVSSGGSTGISDPNSTRDGSVAGARVDQGNITLDGIDANDENTGQPFSTVGNASVDAIQEIRTVTASAGADQGRSSGAQIALTTKSGTNQFHGSLREYNRNTAFEANSFFNNKSGTPVARLNRNQFGGNIGGPIKKDKLFFFFDYEADRQASQANNIANVPFSDVRDGSIAYVNNGPGCDSSSTRVTAPQCISIATPAQVTALDPLHIGPNAALLNVLNQEVTYPQVTDASGGDGVNYGSSVFNSPNNSISSTYIARVDYNPTNKQKVFGRFNIVRQTATQALANLPGQPDTTSFINHDFGFALGHTWTFNANNVNQFVFGITGNRNSFPAGDASPTFPNEVFLSSAITSPYGDIGSQYRIAPIPTIRDDFSHLQGSHNLSFGFNFRPFHTTLSNVRDFNFIGVGLGGNLTALNDSLRPADILDDPITTANWDNVFAQTLGRYSSIQTNYNYDKSGTALPPGTGKLRNFKQREFEIYAQDSWRAKSNLTIGYGLRWQYEGVPFEANGNQTVSTNVDWHDLLNTRIANGIAGDPSNLPNLSYVLGGPVNHGPSYYDQNWKNFAPNVSIAYTPNFKSGFLHGVFGDNKTVIRAGASLAYDRFSVGAFNFIQDQFTYVFQNLGLINFGSTNATASLTNDPRFTGIKDVPVQPAAPVITGLPFTPFTDEDGNPTSPGQQANYTIDNHFKIPYSYIVNFGFQRELKGNFQLEVDYLGRYAHRLFAAADAAQLVDFKDPDSGEMLSTAMNAISAELRSGVDPNSVTPQPFFENQSFPGATQLYAGALFPNFVFGDHSDIIAILAANGLLAPNIGLSGQFAFNLYGTNISSSSYNAMLVSLRKRASNNLQFDFNYTLSHSIDNSSFSTNASKADVGIFAPTICDAIHLRNCRGNSEFDTTHSFNANAIYDLPFGRGQAFGRNASGWLNAIIGGWRVSTIFQAHTGFAMNILSGAWSESVVYTTPAVLTGSRSALRGGIHTVGGNGGDQLQFFANPDAALGAFSEPNFGDGGNRNIGRGPGYWNFDTGVVKDFRMPWSETQRLQFRWETFNTFNHPNFAEPSVDLSSTQSFGVISQTVNGGRVMLFGLRYDF